ncbi:hypothetical protein GOBAR_AA21746 [Gossypium barbadense]|uniref:Putative gamma-glutamylcyclotransferase n=1 Tax=Gossypium barbadense TaxID=3634 RepID=A0A2P5X6G5_GOSBA|nr:hypothetical protein GOBAR_AA21746 [Gossypium barbadense]
MRSSPAALDGGKTAVIKCKADTGKTKVKSSQFQSPEAVTISQTLTNSSNIPEPMNSLLSGPMSGEKQCWAVVNGFGHRFSIKGRVYPAILPVQNRDVSGRVLIGISDPELYILDEFEDVEYQRTRVEVSLLKSSDKLQAHAYVWSNTSDPNLYGDWDFEEWKQVHKESFIKMTMGFMEELELPESKPIGATYESFYQQDDAEK